MGILYVVATPIGNLEDITIRAINVLGNVDFILAEDTRVTQTLLERYNIKKKIISYHQHSTLRRIGEVIRLLGAGNNGALVSDAGMPGVNDPGGYLIQRILEALPDIRIVPIPGANAALSALSISGFPADKFIYLGFPPHKKGRQTFFRNIYDMKETLVLYESKHRILKTLQELRDVASINNRPLVVAREITKQFETIYRGTMENVMMRLAKEQIRGEFVIVIGPALKHRTNAK